MKVIKVIICAALIFLSFISCKLRKEEKIVFDQTHPLALAPDVSWAVVSDPYAAYRKEADWNSNGYGHSRRGDILQVLGQSNDKNGEVWYLFEDGWLPDSCLSVFDNRYKAQAFSNRLEQ